MITVKEGDAYDVAWTVSADLTGYTVRVLAKSASNPAADVLVLPSTVTDAPGGVVTHTLDGTLPLGDYRVEVEITNGATVKTAPTSGYEWLRVIPDLD